MSRSLTFILELYQKTYDKAIQLYSLFDEADSDELLRVQQDLDKLSLELLEAANLDWSQHKKRGQVFHYDMVRVIRDKPRLLRNVKNRLKKNTPDPQSAARFVGRVVLIVMRQK